MAQQLPVVGLASAAQISTNEFFGAVTADIAPGATGVALVEGSLSGYDTSTFAIGDVVYLSDIPGNTSKTAGTTTVIVGRVIDVDSINGAIFFRGVNVPGGDSSGGSGATGVQGITGFQGLTGLDGIQGLTGFQGLTGTIGVSGITGLQGITGIFGSYTGLQGATGIGSGGGGNVVLNAINAGQIVSTTFTVTNLAPLTTTINWNNGNCQEIQLVNGNNTLAFFNQLSSGRYLIRLIQPASGAPGTVTWPVISWPSGVTPTLTVTNGQSDIVTLFYNGSAFYGGFTGNFS